MHQPPRTSTGCSTCVVGRPIRAVDVVVAVAVAVAVVVVAVVAVVAVAVVAVVAVVVVVVAVVAVAVVAVAVVAVAAVVVAGRASWFVPGSSHALLSSRRLGFCPLAAGSHHRVTCVVWRGCRQEEASTDPSGGLAASQVRESAAVAFCVSLPRAPFPPTQSNCAQAHETGCCWHSDPGADPWCFSFLLCACVCVCVCVRVCVCVCVWRCTRRASGNPRSTQLAAPDPQPLPPPPPPHRRPHLAPPRTCGLTHTPMHTPVHTPVHVHTDVLSHRDMAPLLDRTGPGVHALV